VRSLLIATLSEGFVVLAAMTSAVWIGWNWPF